MESKISESSGSMKARQEIDALCQEFENAWKNGESPSMEDFIARVSPPVRAQLIRELLLLEANYRRNGDGLSLSDSQICALHPGLMPDIAEQAELMRGRRSADFSDEAATQLLWPKDNQVEATTGRKSTLQTGGSRGLHIRCPHCSNPVELLADTPFESITCQTCGSAFSLVSEDDQTMQAPTLKKIGRFELVSRIGMGGFGTVWKARDTELDRTVAVKIPRKGQLSRGEVDQFFREARLTAKLRHPNIVPVHEVGREGDTIFIVSDLIRGVSLSDWMSGARANSYVIAQLMSKLANALHHAHEKGIIHRDLKPSNILLDDFGDPHIMDFGLAKREMGEITVTVDGQVLGTPAYMSPEQAAGQAHWTDRRTDIYSLGVVLFRMLTGELPFRGNAQMQIHSRLNDDPPDPRKLIRQLPRDMCTICLKCLERDPNRRFNSARELEDEFGRYLRREPIVSRPIPRLERALRWARRNRALSAAAVLTIILAIAGPITAIVFQRQRAELQARMIENDNLIRRYNDVQHEMGRVDDLRSQLDMWEGRANPWTFWPPKRGEAPRRILIKDVLDHSAATLAGPLRGEKYSDAEKARGYLGLAVLSDAVGKSDDARNYFHLARRELKALQQQSPKDPQIARAAAECDMRLSRLNRDKDPKLAAKNMQDAQAVYKQMASEKNAEPTFQIDWLESELKSAIEATPRSRADHLRRIDDIHQMLARTWPSQPDAIYRLACYLTEQEPILGPMRVAGPSDTSPADQPTTAK